MDENAMDLQGLPQVERWGFIELPYPAEAVESDSDRISDWKTVFTRGSRAVITEPFLGSDGTWRVRFMPDEEGEWLYETLTGSSAQAEEQQKDLAPSGIAGRLFCKAPSAGNHGPVRVQDEWQFAYADGTPFAPFGTTCRSGWRQEYYEATIAALEASPFNKVRFYVNIPEAQLESLDSSMTRLRELGIEAELVLSCKDHSITTRNAIHQLLARLAAYRNVSWALKVPEGQQGWSDALLQLIHSCDPYGRLLTLFSHNPMNPYGDRRISHVSLRTTDASQVSYYARLHRKPVLLDECGCEGNGPTLWGSLPGEELLHRIWESICRGGYAGHGELLLLPDDHSCSWLSCGGALRGEAMPRIAFLSNVLKAAPTGLRYMPEFYDAATIGLDGHYYLQYFGIHRYPSKSLQLPEGQYVIEVIDTWKMTIEQLPGEYSGSVEIPLPGRVQQAIRIRRVDGVPAPNAVRNDADAVRQRLEENDNFI